MRALAIACALATVACGKSSNDKPAADPVPGGHVVKTTAPLAEADLDRLAALTFPGFQTKVYERRDPILEMRHMSGARPRLGAIMRAGACTATSCWPMDLAAWQPHEPELKQILPDDLRNQADLTYELGATTIAGTPMIYTYALGVTYSGATSGGAIGSFVDAYTLFFNDGVNELRVVVAYADDALSTKAELTTAAPRDKLAAQAAQMMAAYVAAW